MNEYLVIARKYRPQQFKDVTGQTHVTTTLTNAITSGRIAHAYLFSGTKGIGKTTIARIMAKALNCHSANKPTPTPCDKCTSCTEIKRGMSMDVLEIDGASNRGIDEIRQLRENVRLAPAGNRFKIYIIDEVHMLTTEAFNALLKTLEEPPAHVKFFFATTAPEKLPATIISRCQRFNLHMLSNQLIVERLQHITKNEKIEIGKESLYTVARYANGSMRDAESTLDKLIAYSGKKLLHQDVLNILGIVDLDILFDISQCVIDSNIEKAISTVTQVFQGGKNLGQFVLDLTTHFRNILLAKQSAEIHKLIDLSAEDISRVITLGKNFSQSQLLEIINILTRLQNELKWSLSKRIALEVGIINIVRSRKKISLDQLIDRLAEIEQNLLATPDTVSAESAAAPTPAPAARKQHNPAPAVSAPVKAPAPAAQPKIAGTETLAQVQGFWKEILNNLGKRRPVLKTYLAEGKISGLKKNTLIINFTPDCSLHQETLSQKGNKEIIEKQIEERIGNQLKVEFVISEKITPANKEERPAARVGKDPLVEKAQRLFGAKIINIKQK